MGRKRHLTGIVLCATFLVAATAALGDVPGNFQIKFNARDQAAARAAVLRRADLSDLSISVVGASHRWKGGMTKPDLSSDPRNPVACRTKESDLVLTGAAASQFSNDLVGLAIMYLRSETRLLKTSRMARLDWQRNMLMPGLDRCMRRAFVRASKEGWLADTKAKLTSFKRLGYPKSIRYPAAFLAVFKLTIKGKPASLASAFQVRYKGRTMVMIGGSALSPVAAMAEAELLLALHQLSPILVERVHT